MDPAGHSGRRWDRAGLDGRCWDRCDAALGVAGTVRCDAVVGGAGTVRCDAVVGNTLTDIALGTSTVERPQMGAERTAALRTPFHFRYFVILTFP